MSFAKMTVGKLNSQKKLWSALPKIIYACIYLAQRVTHAIKFDWLIKSIVSRLITPFYTGTSYV